MTRETSTGRSGLAVRATSRVTSRASAALGLVAAVTLVAAWVVTAGAASGSTTRTAGVGAPRR